MPDVSVPSIPFQALPVLADSILGTNSASSNETVNFGVTGLARRTLASRSEYHVYASNSRNVATGDSAYTAAGASSDEDVFNAAITAASGFGSLVVVHAGLYTWDGSCTASSDVDVVCERGVTIARKTGATLTNMLTIPTGTSNFSWRGGTFDGNLAGGGTLGQAIGDGTTNDNILLEHIEVTNTDIAFNISSTPLTDGSPFTIRNCHIYDVTDKGIQIARNHFRLIENFIHDMGVEAPSGLQHGSHGIKILCDYGHVWGNRIFRIAGQGIEVFGGVDVNTATIEWRHHLNIQYNWSCENRALGIHGHDIDFSIVSNNVFNNNEGNGLDFNSARNCTISNNHMCFNGSQRGNADRWSAEGNGIFLFKVQDSKVFGNHCLGNSQGQIPGTGDPRSGIRLSYQAGNPHPSQWVKISDNFCYDPRITYTLTSVGPPAVATIATTTFKATMGNYPGSTTPFSAPEPTDSDSRYQTWAMTVSAGTLPWTGNFTMNSVGNTDEVIIVRKAPVDSDGNIISGNWEILRDVPNRPAETKPGGGTTYAAFTGKTEVQPVGREWTLRATQSYGVALKMLSHATLPDDPLLISNIQVTGNVIPTGRNVTGTIQPQATSTSVNIVTTGNFT